MFLTLTASTAWGAYGYTGEGTFTKQNSVDGDGYYVFVLTQGALTTTCSSNYITPNATYKGSEESLSNVVRSSVFQVTNYDATDKDYYILTNNETCLYSSGSGKITYSDTYTQTWKTESSKLQSTSGTTVYMGCVNSKFRPYTSSSTNATSFVCVYKLQEANVEYSITLSENGKTKTETITSASYQLPTELSVGSCDSKTFVGWTTTKNFTSAKTPTSGDYYEKGETISISGDEIFYAVFATTSGGDGEITTTKTETFENQTSYSSESNWRQALTWSASESKIGVEWTTYYGKILASDDYVELRTYSDRVMGYICTSQKLKGIKSIQFNGWCVNSTDKADMVVSYSTDNETWNELGTHIAGTTSTSQSNIYTLPDYGVDKEYYISIDLQNATCPNSSNKKYRIDNIALTFVEGSGTTYSDYTTSCSTETSVTLQPNGGTGTAQVLETTDGSLTLPECDFIYEGYRFVGWNTKANGTGTTYQPSAEYTPTENPATLYAKWAKEYTVTYNANGGTTTCEDNKKYIAGEQVTVCTSAPTRDSYTFNGWSYSPNVAITDGQFSMPANDVTITAQWTSNKIATSLSWSAATYSATIDADNTFPTLTISPNDLIGVTYSSSKTSVATIDANTGNITLVAAGTTTITATFTETNTHAGSTASYTLTVNPSNCRWVEVTDNTTLEDGDWVVIAMANAGNVYALPNDKGATTPEANLLNNIDGNKITTVGEKYKWTVEKSEDNYIFHPNGNAAQWLYCINSDDGVRVGTGTAKTFILDPTNGYLVNTQTKDLRYLRLGVSDNINYVWRCYTTNTAGQTLKFYKRECLDASKVWVEGNFTNVTCDTQLPQQLAKDGSITLTFTAADGYALPNDVTVNGATKTWDKANGKLTISDPTDNVMVTVSAVELHTITWMVGSNSVLTEEVANATGVTKTPADPVNGAIGNCADAFVGWTETSLGSAEGQSAPADLCTAAQMKSKHISVTGDKTFYAVFATASSGGGENTAQVFATTDIVSSTGVTHGYTISALAEKESGYYQDGSGTKRYVQVMKSDVSTPMIANIPISVTVTAKLGGGTAGKELTNPVYAILLDVDGEELGSAVKLTDKITHKEGSEFTANLPVADATSAYGVRVYHQKETGYNVRYYGISLSYKYNNITYSNYVTNCCALAPATNLTVSGTTANSATLTWTTPSSTTGITKLQVRNAETDDVVEDNIAINTTTATITGLTECTSYQYYVVSVGKDCEVVSNTVTAQPYGSAKTVNYDYNGGSGSVTSFTTSCTNQTITLPTATRTGYDFNGWYTDATGGTRVGGANDTYEPATSPVTLYAQWTIKSYTVTWNPNGGKWGESTSSIVETYEYGAAIKEPADPKRENGIFKGWNPSVPSNMPAGNQTYTAQWEMVYTLTFVDMNAGGTTSTLTQTSSGQNIVAPTANSEVCDMWTFIGWAPSNSLNGGTDKPTGFIAAGETIPGSQITGNKTYYSVYSYNSDNTQEFEVGKSGTYLMYAISSGTKYYATTAKTGGFYGNPETSFATYGGPSKFTLTYNKTEEKYIIYHENTTSGKESQGYFELDTSDGDVDVKSETPSLFTIQAGSNGAFIIRTDYSNKERSFGYDGSFTDYSGDNPIYFEPASEIQYYNAADCGEVETYTMSFHNPFGDENALIWYDAEHEELYYTDKPLNTSIDVFPTMVYNGWTFIGWTANQQYNNLIGEENLDDENSATDDPADLVSTIYSNEAGWAYNLTSNVTMYPVFTKFEDNEPFDMVNGGDYYIYYIADADITASVDKYGAVNRIYAGAWESGGTSDSYGATQSCTNATLFTFTKLSNGKWTIYDNTNRKYLCAGATDNNLALNATAATNGEWTITVHNGNQVNAVSKDGYTLSALSQNAVSGTFKNYATSNFNNNSGYYHRVYLGSCTERVYSSNPSNKPIITLSGTPQVTSTQNQSIRAQGELSISATKLAANATITLTADNEDVYFATDKTANFSKATKPVTPLTLKADEKGKLAMTTVYVHYKPTSPSTLGVQTANITATTGTDGQPDYATATTIAALRNLPAKFVIATKVGATWYALPANMNGATNPEGVVIDVDETTMTATAPNTTVYTLFPVKTTSTQYDRFADFGDRVRFSAVNNESKGLWATSNGNTINNGAQIASESDGGTTDNTNPSYEWKITTTIVNGNWQYTLQTDQTNNQKYLRYYNSKWGTYANGENDLYFLPVTEVEPFEMQVVEWYPTKVLVQTEATLATVSATIGGEEVAEPVVTQKGGKLYEISNLPLETNPTKLLAISYTADEITYANNTVIPIIISRAEKNIADEPFATLTADVYNSADLVVRDGAVLTVNGTEKANTFANVTIYPTAKISVPAMNKNGANNKLSVNSLTFFGGIDEIYDGSTYTINKYGVPELSLKGLLNKTTTQMDYIMRVDLDQMYSLTVPYDVQLADIKYWDGSDIALGDALYVSAYDGEARANQSKKTWIYETDFESRLGAATLKAGVGYTISAELQSGVGSEYSILRMPMMSNVASGATEAAKTVAVTAWGKDANVTDNHKGWNLVGNPYMTTIQGADDADLVLGYLQETGTGPWKWVDDGIRYVTIPSDDGTYYWQQKFTTAELPPFKNFFVQIGTTGELQFGLSTRQSMPARSTQAAIEKEVEFEILMSNDARQDNTGLLISEEYSPAYEINADLEKMIGSMSVYTIYGGYKLAYNALSPINASEWIPMGYIAPAAGEYTFRLDDVENIAEQVEHVYIIDYNANNIVDLMDEEYKFTTDKEQNDNRFAINVVLSQDKDNTTTGMDMIQDNNAAPIKFIHQDKMYIYNDGIIYDATGKQVTNINK